MAMTINMMLLIFMINLRLFLEDNFSPVPRHWQSLQRYDLRNKSFRMRSLKFLVWLRRIFTDLQ